MRHTYTMIDKRTGAERWSGKAADAEDAIDKWIRAEGWGRYGCCTNGPPDDHDPSKGELPGHNVLHRLRVRIT